MIPLTIFFKNMTFVDVLDIFMVAFITYQFLLIIQGTRAVQMIIGVGILVILFWASFNYELYSLNWVLSHLFDYSFIFLIIVFQDHIRRALVSFGAGRIFGKYQTSQMNDVIDEVAMACSYLSRSRTGGLIVFEKMNGLLNYSESGTILNCDIHSDILCSILQQRSPLHDGAIIIVNGKIQAAGCFLPLTKNIEMKQAYGTRHRAGLGLSEITDAVVVIVSEETGDIRVCYEGKMHHMVDENSLRLAVKNIFIHSAIMPELNMAKS